MLRWRITGFQSKTYVEFMSGWFAASLGHVHREFINFLEARENKNPFFLQKAAVPEEVNVLGHADWKGQTPCRAGSPWSARESRKVNRENDGFPYLISFRQFSGGFWLVFFKKSVGT